MKEYDPFKEYRMYGAPYMQTQRTYVKPKIVRRQQYNPEEDLNQTARMVINGAVVVGTLGLLGSMFNR